LLVPSALDGDVIAKATVRQLPSMGEGTIRRFRMTRGFAREAAASGPIESYEFNLLRDSKVVSQAFSSCTRDAAVRFRSELAFMK